MYYSEKEQNNEKNDRNERKEGWGEGRKKELDGFLMEQIRPYTEIYTCYKDHITGLVSFSLERKDLLSNGH